MVQFSSELAEMRFGCGMSPQIPAPASVEAMLAGVSGPDQVAQRFPVPRLSATLPQMRQLSQARRAAHKAKGSPEYRALSEKSDQIKHAWRQQELRWMGQAMLRQTWTEYGFRERLAGFWADHFTAQGKNPVWRPVAAPFIEEAIRPHLGGRFSDMLVAVVQSPLMLHYLDQDRSVGPNSRFAKARENRKGLNENLAREVLELHTLGVDGPYTQTDVRQLAELFAGLSLSVKEGFVFRPAFSEPGAETILGHSYGGGKPDIADVQVALEDLAMHPVTARHLAHKLAVHFTTDQPEPDLVDHIVARYLASGGALLDTYAALLEHPAAWQPELRNVKPPSDFVGSACRALAVDPRVIEKMSIRHLRARFVIPMRLMGQQWLRPAGPDGWPEADSHWITPQNLAARMRWAMAVPRKLQTRIAEPIDFAQMILGSRLDPTVRFAATAAETRPEAIGLILASPAFQRR